MLNFEWPCHIHSLTGSSALVFFRVQLQPSAWTLGPLLTTTAASLALWHFLTSRKTQYFCYKACGHEDQLVYLCPWMSATWGKISVLLDKILKHNLKASPAGKTQHEVGENLLGHCLFESWSCIEADIDTMQMMCDRVPSRHPSGSQF